MSSVFLQCHNKLLNNAPDFTALHLLAEHKYMYFDHKAKVVKKFTTSFFFQQLVWVDILLKYRGVSLDITVSTNYIKMWLWPIRAWLARARLSPEGRMYLNT